MTQLDPRLLRVTIIVNGEARTYEDLSIQASGVKSGSFVQNECDITILNIDKETRDTISTEGSPLNRLKNTKRNRIILEAGRKSYGYFVLFEGDISTAFVTQPPDIGLRIKAIAQQYAKGNVISRSENNTIPFSQLCQKVADDLGVALSFNATEKNIANYTFTGSAEKQIEKLYQYGDVDAYVDEGTLFINDRDVALPNSLRLLNKDTGLLGIPEFVDFGVRVQFFVDNVTKVGTLLRIESEIYPAANGDYKIYKLNFDVANREQPFYYVAEALRLNQ